MVETDYIRDMQPIIVACTNAAHQRFFLKKVINMPQENLGSNKSAKCIQASLPPPVPALLPPH